jgi:hypothetical protein
MKDIVMNAIKLICCAAGVMLMSSWGFFGHERINRLAVFTLPPEMFGFYKTHIGAIVDASVNPDKRRYAVAEEAPRHYIDLDDYEHHLAIDSLPVYWHQAVEKYGEDSLMAHGVVPWHIHRMFHRLKSAFMVRDPQAIIRMSAELGHYIADANVPLHTTSNYNGQKTGQHGIHGLWESRLPESFFNDYSFFVGRAQYVDNVQESAWSAVWRAHAAVDSVLSMEKQLNEKLSSRKYSFETKGTQTIKVYSMTYTKAYHEMMNGMVERQMRHSIKMIGDYWYTAWVDAGQPDLQALIKYQPSEEELAQRKREVEEWKSKRVIVRSHDD